MSNKPKNFKKNNETQIGNFLVSKFGDDIKTIKVKSVTGNWSIQWRSDSEFYALIESMLKQEGQVYFQNFIISCFAMSNGVKDNQFLNDFAKIWQEQNERFRSQESVVSEEENQVIINEEKEKYNAKNNNNKI